MIYLNSVREYWFNGNDLKNKWFRKKNRELLDNEIKVKFNEILISIENQNIEHLLLNDPLDIVSIIICLDQFSRHIYRNTNPQKIEENTKQALILGRYLCKAGFIYREDFKSYIPFILMPFKHLDIFKYFQEIHTFITKIIDIKGYKECNIWRFYLDSLKKYLLNDNQLSLIKHINNDDMNNVLMNTDIDNIKKVCEFYPDCLADKQYINTSEKLFRSIDNYYKKYKHIIYKKIIVSLSGGPDSMVLIYLMNGIGKKYGIDVEGFHINYKNRTESDYETSMIITFCYYTNIKLHIYEMPFIRREICPRDYYEKYSRILRFNLYKSFNCPIVLGHIKEDLVENIWSNLSKGHNIFKLHKISEIDRIDDVLIMRPFCRIVKNDIFDFAHKFNIPYLKDTTPDWSNRGKMRRRFIPETIEQFGYNIDNKLLYVSDTLESYDKLLEKKIFKPFYNTVELLNYGIRVNIGDYMDMECIFWEKILTYLFHNINENKPSIKSITNFTNMIKTHKTGVINLKNTVYCYIDKKLDLYLLPKKRLNSDFNYNILNGTKWKKIIKTINSMV